MASAGTRFMKVLVWGFAFLVCAEAFAKKDFKGLFGSYRREKFTENEANSSDFGMDIMLSTLLPVTPIVKSSEVKGSPGEAMSYSTFFNFETSFFLTLSYHWELFANVGYYTYETSKANATQGNPALPLFHLFEMDVFPAVLGVKYRFGTDDIVPYVGAGVGAAYVRRKGYYDYNSVNFNEEYSTVLAAQLVAGIEFFFSSRAGIRLETAAHYLRLAAKEYATGGSATTFPIMIYQGNPWAIRYASGIFFLF